MPLIDCPDCKKQVSDQAPACPNCGRKIAQETKKSYLTKNLGCAGVFFVGLIAVGIYGVINYFDNHDTEKLATSIGCLVVGGLLLGARLLIWSGTDKK